MTAYSPKDFYLNKGEGMYEDNKTEAVPVASGRLGRESVLANLKRREERLSTELSDVREAISALQENPQIADVLHKISKAGGY